jgi:aspartyl-tRNA(Asn)/glutamyl-tRNA(Gln) amidotransferase subunit C
MTITKEAVKRLAHLARIALNDDQVIESIQTDLSRIVTMIDQISTANTEIINCMPHHPQALRKDEIDPIAAIDNRETLLALAPKAESGLYLVPLMIEEA